MSVKQLCPNMKFGMKSTVLPLMFLRIKGRFVSEESGECFFIDSVTNRFVLNHLGGRFRLPANDNGGKQAA